MFLELFAKQKFLKLKDECMRLTMLNLEQGQKYRAPSEKQTNNGLLANHNHVRHFA